MSVYLFPVTFRHKVPLQAVLQWSVALSLSTMDEGDSVDLTVSVALNAYSPAAGEFAYVTLTTMTGSDFAAAFSGETQASVAAGDFAQGYTEAFKAAIEALGGTGEVITLNGISAIVLGFKIDTFTSVSITRVSVERAGDNGSRRLVHSISSPSNGVVLAASDSVVIADISLAPGAGDLATGELSADLLDVLITSPGTSPSVDTRIGRFIGRDSALVEKTLSAVTFLSGGDAGGRFKITNAGGGNFYLDTTSVLADFEDSTPPLPVSDYSISVSMTSGAITISASLKVRPRYPFVNPDGGPATATDHPTTMDELYTILAASPTDRTIDLDLMTGVHTREKTGAATFTNGSAVIGAVGHTLSVGNRVYFQTGGTLPTNFTVFTTATTSAESNADTPTPYYVVSVVAGVSLQLSATSGGAAITAGSAGSGVHTWHSPITTQLKPTMTRSTLRGHAEVAIRHGRGWSFRQGNDVVLESLALRSGELMALLGGATRDVDNATWGFQGEDWARNILVRNSEFTNSNDEQCRPDSDFPVAGTTHRGTRHLRFEYTMFYEAFHNGGHSKGANHEHGPAASGWIVNVGFDHCMISGDIRNPRIAKGPRGAYVRNCLIYNWGGGAYPADAGIDIVCTDDTLANAKPTTVRLEGNLFYRVGGLRNTAIVVYRGQETISNIYIPSSGNYQNYFCDPATDTFTDDPLTLGDGIQNSGSSSDAIINTGTPGFELASAQEALLVATNSEALRRALKDDLIANCGNGSQYGADIKALIAAGTTRSPGSVTPTTHRKRYGWNWDGITKHGITASLGHGVV